MDLLKDYAIELLNNFIVLWGVIDSKFLLCALPFEMENELLPSIFTSVVRVKGAHSGIVLSVERCFILLVCMKGVTLVFEEVEVGQAGFVIHKTNIVPALFDCSNR